MGIRRSSRRRAPPKTGLADALFSATQQRVFGLLFGQADRSFTQRELIALASSGSGAVQRELARLVANGLVAVSVLGNQKRYQANRASPIFEELKSIVDKTSGIPGELRAALAPLSDRMVVALLFGSVAKGSDRATSDIDVLVVSDELTLEQVFAALRPAEMRLGRVISPTLITTAELARRLREKQAFLTNVLAGEHVVLWGDPDAVAAAR